MKNKTLSILLVIIMVVCFAGALSYPVRYFLQKESNETDMEDLRALKRSALEDGADPQQTPAIDASSLGTEVPTTGGSVSTEAAVDGSEEIAPAGETEVQSEGTEQTEAADSVAEEQAVTPQPTDRYYYENTALPYPNKEKVELDAERILPEYREMYDLNNDLVGWLTIPGTIIDYPVVQNEESDYYLRRDFYGNRNSNGQIILDSACDPYTPSYNLVISGHNMNSGKMFGQLSKYTSKSFWQSHKTFTFDTLMREGEYVVYAAFYSADYGENEEGFRYNADIQYRLDAELWLEQIEENRIYETGVDAEFGDEFLTLTTCEYHRLNGRFVVVARRIRDGEVIE